MKKIIIISLTLPLIIISTIFFQKTKLDSLFKKIYIPISKQKVDNDLDNILKLAKKNEFKITHIQNSDSYTIRYDKTSSEKNKNLIKLDFKDGNLKNMSYLDKESFTYINFYLNDNNNHIYSMSYLDNYLKPVKEFKNLNEQKSYLKSNLSSSNDLTNYSTSNTKSLFPIKINFRLIF